MSEIRPIKNAADPDVVRFVIWRAVIDGSDQFRYVFWSSRSRHFQLG